MAEHIAVVVNRKALPMVFQRSHRRCSLIYIS
jgi:hypothetical protein